MQIETGTPQILMQTRPSATILRRRLLVGPDLEWFEGHFPGEPILAGVVQLKWAIEAAAVLLESPRQPQGIHQLKFKAPIRAGATVELELELLAGNVVLFSYSSDIGVNSSGRLQF